MNLGKFFIAQQMVRLGKRLMNVGRIRHSIRSKLEIIDRFLPTFQLHKYLSASFAEASDAAGKF